ncbi:MAG: hypothetical protein M1813_008513 [Trichoglossum hirsutum]|nr:MAG: hypothetical protein M1813_008513 [Trichoglossum hirsutum]
MAIGPSMNAFLSNKALKTSLSIQVGLVLPRMKVCFKEEHNVDTKCHPKGPIPDALSVATIMAIGLELTVEAEVFGFSLIDSIMPGDLIALGVYRNWTLSTDCADRRVFRPGEPLDTKPKSVVDGKDVTPVNARAVEGRHNITSSGELVPSRYWRGGILRQWHEWRNSKHHAPPFPPLRRPKHRLAHRPRSLGLMGRTVYKDR